MSETGSNLSAATSPDEPENKATLSVVQTAGSQLSFARVQAGLSLQQVADQLKLSQRQIAALEANQFDDLPAMVIVRGFVRSYAKLLKLDPAPVIACLPAEAGVPGQSTDLRPTLATPFMESRTPFLGRQDNNNRKYLIGAALLAAFALIFVGVQKLEKIDYFKNLMPSSSLKKVAEDQVASTEQTPARAGSETPAEVPLSTVVAPVVTQKVEPQESPASNAKLAQDEHAASAAVAAPTRIATVIDPAPVSAPAVPTVTAPQAVVANGNNQLKLKFRQDSWIQVKRENGTVLTSHLAKAGTEEFFDLKDALQIRIGNAAGVDGWLRGNTMGIAPTKDSNVVNLNVK
ncbi:helix-turn-helix domain-containing protein [Undibacterium sp. TJN19]|uniref:helix-turn-helix domain-containing protein n=1 Tax=Undibacterium sp. TJN19 TaxID=3413055 RepID=UPI003BEFF8D3